MTNVKANSRVRKIGIAALLGIVAATATAFATGVANAEAGARLCGKYMVNPTRDRVVTRIYEVPNSTIQNTACDQALIRDVTTPPFAVMNTLNTDDFSGWTTGTFSMVVCETWKTRPLLQGGLEAHNVIFEGTGWPANDQQDICKDMTRSSTYLSMHTYWLAWYGGPLLNFYR